VGGGLFILHFSVGLRVDVNQRQRQRGGRKLLFQVMIRAQSSLGQEVSSAPGHFFFILFVCGCILMLRLLTSGLLIVNGASLSQSARIVGLLLGQQGGLGAGASRKTDRIWDRWGRGGMGGGGGL